MYFLPPFQEEEMVFLEEGLSVGVLPHRADGPVTDLCVCVCGGGSEGLEAACRSLRMGSM